MIQVCHGDIFKMELCYFDITEFNIHNRKKFCIPAFLHKRTTLIAARFEYL